MATNLCNYLHSVVLNATNAAILDPYVTYIIDQDITISGIVSLPEGSNLIFNGGKFKCDQSSGATLNFKKNHIDSIAQAFEYHVGENAKNIEFGLENAPVGITNEFVPVSWFGIFSAINDNNNSNHTSEKINWAIRFCIETYARRLAFPQGTFHIHSNIYLGITCVQNDNYFIGNYPIEHKHCDLKIYGAGNMFECGTEFILYDDSTFIVDMRNPVGQEVENNVLGFGDHRGGGIYDCTFISHQANNDNTKRTTGIYMLYATTYSIFNCRFKSLNIGITMQGPCYYVNINSCIFDNNNYGVKTEERPTINNEDWGTPNNNMISGCMFTYCTTSPVDVMVGNQWHIIDSDFEGNNGPIKLGNNHRMTNVRIERCTLINTLVPTHWLEFGSYCDIDADVHGDDYSASWRVICKGDKNKVKLNFHSINYNCLISYGYNNEFRINVSSLSEHESLFIFDPNDVFVMNGKSNKENFLSSNIIKEVVPFAKNANMQLTSLNNQGICFPLSSTCINAKFNLVNQPTEKLFKSCTFAIQRVSSNTDDRNVNVLVFAGANMAIDDNKWYCCASCICLENGYIGENKISQTSDTEFSIYRNQNNNIHFFLSDAAVSIEAPLYNRPVLLENEGVTHNPLHSDNIIHLTSCKLLNYELSTFGMVKNNPQIYVNILGKTYYRRSDGKFISNGKLVSNNSGCMCSSNNGSLPYILSGMLEADVEVYSKDGERFMSLHAQRSSTSQVFTISNIFESGLTYKSNNAQ